MSLLYCFLVQRQCLLDSLCLIIFYLLHIHPFFTHTAESTLKLKVHQGFVLCTSCVSEKVAINEKGKKSKMIFPLRNKGQSYLTSDLRGLKLGGGLHRTGD